MVSRHPATSLRAGSRTQDGESLLGVQQIDADVIEAKTFPDQVYGGSEQHTQVEGADGSPSDLGRGLDLQGIAMEGVLERGADTFLFNQDIGFACPEVTLHDSTMILFNLLQTIHWNVAFQ